MREKFAVGALMILTVLLSGCTMPWEQQVVTTGTQELTIEGFGPSHTYVRGGDTEEFVLTIRNNGDQNVEDVWAVPFLIGWQGFTGEQGCQNLPLYGPNEELNRLGTPCTMRWRNVQVPDVTKAETYTAGVKVYYDYSTEATAKIYAISSDAYANYRERGVDLRAVKELDPGKGPIQVNIMVDDVLIYGGNNYYGMPVTLKLINTGAPYGYPSGETLRDFQIYGVDVTSDSASGISAIDTSDCDGAKLTGGREGTCMITLNVNGGYNQEEIIANLKIIVYYTYVKEVTKTFTVNPRL